MDGVDDASSHVIALGVHGMLRGVVLLDQAEGVDADLKLDGPEVDVPPADAPDELGREVEAGRGGRG